MCELSFYSTSIGSPWTLELSLLSTLLYYLDGFLSTHALMPFAHHSRLLLPNARNRSSRNEANTVVLAAMSEQQQKQRGVYTLEWNRISTMLASPSPLPYHR